MPTGIACSLYKLTLWCIRDIILGIVERTGLVKCPRIAIGVAIDISFSNGKERRGSE